MHFSNLDEVRFEGVLSLWLGVVLSVLAGSCIFWLYRRETSLRSGCLSVSLPVLRALAVAMIVLMLTGPVIRGSIDVGGDARVMVFLDGSKSMELTDKTMSQERKWLSARRLGWVSEEAIDTSLYDAAQRLASIRPLAEETSARDAVERYRRHVASAIEVMDEQEPLRERMEQTLQSAADRLFLLGEDPLTSDERLERELESLRVDAESWVERLQQDYRERMLETSPSDARPNAAVDRLDEWSRWRRAESLLLDGDSALLPNLAGGYQVDLFKLSGAESDSRPTRLWRPLSPSDFPDSFEPLRPDGSMSDLATEIETAVTELPTTEQLAVVLMSDGRHNHDSGVDQSTPQHVARLLGRRGVPIFTIGFGVEKPPPDLAVLGVQTPDKVFADDRVTGEISLKDDMPAGEPFTIKVEIDEQTVWSEQATTTGTTPRSLHFDFPIKALVEDRLATEVRESNAVSLPLPVKVVIEPVDGESRDDNNSYETTVRAITRPRRALLIDGRPRWEFRYVRNLLDRDEHWQVNHVLVEAAGGRSVLPRSRRGGGFPLDRDQLFGYDMIVIGEVPSGLFRDAEFEWLDQFVSLRGGGLMLIDGQRGRLRTYADSPLKKLLPVNWIDRQQQGLRQVILEPTQRGLSTSALALGGDPVESASRWTQLPRVRWLAPVEAMPGCETLLRGRDGDRTGPALVMRRYGAGTVLYSGFDDSWRWRYEVADLVHQRYWNQVANFVMESPFSVHDQYVSIDTGGFLYQPGQTADLQIRLRDRSGQPVSDVEARALLYQEEELVGTVPLAGDTFGGGILRGTTQPLEAGTYTVAVEAEGFDDEMLAVRAEFAVVGNASGELNVLSSDEDALRQMAELSGGEFLREEDAGRLLDLLTPHFDNHEEPTEFVIWRSWYFFLPLVGLFTMEWLIRKRLGMM